MKIELDTEHFENINVEIDEINSEEDFMKSIDDLSYSIASIYGCYIAQMLGSTNNKEDVANFKKDISEVVDQYFDQFMEEGVFDSDEDEESQTED